MRSSASSATGESVAAWISKNLRRACALSRAQHKAHYPESSVIRSSLLLESGAAAIVDRPLWIMLARTHMEAR